MIRLVSFLEKDYFGGKSKQHEMKSVKILSFFSFFLLAQVGCTVSDPEMMELLQEIKVQNDKLLQEVESMKGQLSLLDGKYQVILASLADNKKELEALKGQIDALKGQIAQQLIKIDQLSVQLTKQGADLVKLSAEIAELKASCEELKGLMEELLTGKSPVPTNGLVAWWPFNGNANDESGNGNNGLAVGPTLTTNRTGESNSAYLFDGTNDYINISPALSELNSLSEITISTWIYKDGAGLGTYFSHWIDNGQPSTPIGITQAINSSDKFTVAMIGGQQTSSQSSISLNNWNNITLVYNGSNLTGSKLKLYVNGVFIENMPDTNIPLKSGMVANRTYIGANAAFPDNFNNSIYQYFKGKIDDVAIWNRGLTTEEISKIYKGEKF